MNPLVWPAWDRFVSRHPDASVFHSSAWAAVLAQTYGFKLTYLAQMNEGEPVAAWPLAEVGGWLRKSRGVSLPFTDFCPPLVKVNRTPMSESREKDPLPHGDSAATASLSATDGAPLDRVAEKEPLLAEALALGRRRKWRSIELRGAPTWTRSEQVSTSYYGHTIDLSKGGAEAINRCDSSVRRAIRKAESADLRVVESSDEAGIKAYFALHCLTRRRHGLPPQPYDFFAKLQKLLLAPGHGLVLLVLKDQTPIAGAVFLFWGDQALYKFGASDETFQRLRPNNLVFKEAMRVCVDRRCTALDLGRTSLQNEGLRRFKLGWGSSEAMVPYIRYDLRRSRVIPTLDRSTGWHSFVFRYLPASLGSLIGRFGYRFAA